MKITVRNINGGSIEERPIEGDVFDIRIGEGRERLTIRIRDGRVEVQADDPLALMPRATNTVWISTKSDLP